MIINISFAVLEIWLPQQSINSSLSNLQNVKYLNSS